MSARIRNSLLTIGLTIAAILVVLLVPYRAAVGAGLGAKTNVVVLCSSCGIPGASETPHLIILDQETGDVWAYKELNQKPVYMGKLRLGLPTQK